MTVVFIGLAVDLSVMDSRTEIQFFQGWELRIEWDRGLGKASGRNINGSS